MYVHMCKETDITSTEVSLDFYDDMSACDPLCQFNIMLRNFNINSFSVMQ